MDFQTVDKYASNELCIVEAGRMRGLPCVIRPNSH